MAKYFQYMFEFVVDNLTLTPDTTKGDTEKYATCCEIHFRSIVSVEISEEDYGSCVYLCAPKCGKSCLFSLEKAISRRDCLRILVKRKATDGKSKVLLGIGELLVQSIFGEVTTSFENQNPECFRKALQQSEGSNKAGAQFRSTSALTKNGISLFDVEGTRIGTLTLMTILICNGPVLLKKQPKSLTEKTSLSSLCANALQCGVCCAKSSSTKFSCSEQCVFSESKHKSRPTKRLKTSHSFVLKCANDKEALAMQKSLADLNDAKWKLCTTKNKTLQPYVKGDPQWSRNFKKDCCKVRILYDNHKYVPSSWLLNHTVPAIPLAEWKQTEPRECKLKSNLRPGQPRLTAGESQSQSKETTEMTANEEGKEECCCKQFGCPAPDSVGCTMEDSCDEESSDESACMAPCFMAPSRPDPGPEAYEEFEACLNGSGLTIRVLKDTHKMDSVYDGTEGNLDEDDSDCGCSNRQSKNHDCCESLEQIVTRSPYAKNALRRRTGGCIVNHPKIPKVKANIKYAGADIGCMENYKMPFGKLRDQCRGMNKLDEYRKRGGEQCDCGPIVPPKQMDDTRSCCLQVDPAEITNVLQGVDVDTRRKGIEVCYKTCEDAASDVFLVKLGTKKPCERKQHSVEIELKTPRIPIPCTVQKCTTETQVKEAEIDSAMGGGGGGGKKGKKGK